MEQQKGAVNKFERGILIFILYCFRPIWSTFFKVIFWFISFIKVVADKNIAKLAEMSAREFNSIGGLPELISYFQEKYKYHYDGVKGIFDHDNSRLEFFTRFGDCDDMALYSKIKLKEFGYEPVRIFMMSGEGLTTGHMDCFFKLQDRYYLFNYGHLIEGANLDECIKGLDTKYYKRNLYFKYYL